LDWQQTVGQERRHGQLLALGNLKGKESRPSFWKVQGGKGALSHQPFPRLLERLGDMDSFLGRSSHKPASGLRYGCLFIVLEQMDDYLHRERLVVQLLMRGMTGTSYLAGIAVIAA